MGTQAASWWVDNAAHMLHRGEQAFPCDRDVVRLALCGTQALLLSADTDCLSLWDGQGVVRTARVGVYPQDMAIAEDMAVICGGADGRLHLLTLPELRTAAEIPLPGLPERIALHGGDACVLTLLTEPALETTLIRVELTSGRHREVARYAGLPGAVCLTDDGLWVAAGSQLLRLRLADMAADLAIDGFGLIGQLTPCVGGVMALDLLEERAVWVAAAPRPTVVPLVSSGSDLTCLIP